jgi:hypothetical protein
MSPKFVTAVFLVMAATSAPAYACSMTQGSQVINPPSFQNPDPAWGPINSGTFTVGGGTAKVTVPAQQWGGMVYGGAFIDTGDVCVDIVLPSDNTAGAGIAFSDTNNGTYMFEIWGNGEADVAQWTPEGWLYPVAETASPAAKTGANATNELRITWNGTSASAYINGQLFQTFPLAAVQGSKLGLEVEAGSSQTAPTTAQFSNLSVTQIAK